MNNRILVVDDDVNICELVRLYLEKDGYKVLTSHNGEEALKLYNKENPELCILDIMLPGMDGVSLCREIRKSGDTPVIMLTAKGETFDKVLGLEMGADDYIVKPFDARELVARVKAVFRRYDKKETDSKIVHYNNLEINLTTYELKINGEAIETPPKEMELIYFLASHPNCVFTREQLLEKVWEFDYFGDSRTVDVHIKRLRQKLSVCTDENWELKTVWGVGYKFEVK